MKKLSVFLTLALLVSVLAGCAGTPVVYYTDCTCPVEMHEAAPEVEETELAEGSLKTGLYLCANIGKSKSASAEADGEGKYDVTMVAVLVDGKGIIRDCIIDSIDASVTFDNTGAITADLTKAPQTKNELGADYGMAAVGAVAEWDAQAAELADFAVGLTAEQLRSGAVDETGYAPEGTDLASSATIYLGGYVSAIEKAVANARDLGAKVGDELKMACTTGIGSSTSADAETAGNAQLDVDVAVLTVNGEIITSCVIDAVQAKVAFDAAGAVTADLSAPVQTKNELGANYGMVAWGNASAEWNEQAASFAEYVTGKTPADVAGIAVDESKKPTGVDLVNSVTISIGGFQALITKAAQ